ncbi:MAG: energy transducer TonB [Planctomycetota bacterium]
MWSRIAKNSLRGLGSTLAACGVTLSCFLVLPVLQAIAGGSRPDTIVQAVDSTVLPPPPPPPQDEPEPEPEPEEQPEQPPELDNAPPPDLSSLEMDVGGGSGGAFATPNFDWKVGEASEENDVDALFSMADLDQPPRALYQAPPVLTAKERKYTPATVYILFIVDRDGNVKDPKVQNSVNPALDRAALKAVSKWRFEPGKRSGKPVSFRMRVPIKFPKS